jgi:hypothetical protein
MGDDLTSRIHRDLPADVPIMKANGDFGKAGGAKTPLS